MDVARGVSEEEVCEVLEQYTKQETELTEVSQQLWFVNHCSGRFSGHNYATKLIRIDNKEGLRNTHKCMHVRTRTRTRMHTHTHTHHITLTVAHVHTLAHTY